MISWMQRSSGGVSRWVLYLTMLVLAFIMLFPFFYVMSVSLSSYKDVAGGGLILFPKNPTLDAYRWVLEGSNVLQALGISLFLATVGTLVNMIFTVTMAYGLSRRDVLGIKVLLWMSLITLLIAPSIITKYLVVKELRLLDTLWSLILPTAIAPFNLIVMRQFFMGIPSELIESAKLDGANDLQILWRIVLPLSKAVLAAIGLFYAIGHWNSFFDAVIYLNNSSLYPVSVVLRQVVLQGNEPTELAGSDAVPPPDLSIQMAVVVLATLPILLVYPFLQRYFTKGVLTGSIKG